MFWCWKMVSSNSHLFFIVENNNVHNNNHNSQLPWSLTMFRSRVEINIGHYGYTPKKKKKMDIKAKSGGWDLKDNWESGIRKVKWEKKKGRERGGKYGHNRCSLSLGERVTGVGRSKRCGRKTERFSAERQMERESRGGATTSEKDWNGIHVTRLFVLQPNSVRSSLTSGNKSFGSFSSLRPVWSFINSL